MKRAVLSLADQQLVWNTCVKRLTQDFYSVWAYQAVFIEAFRCPLIEDAAWFCQRIITEEEPFFDYDLKSEWPQFMDRINDRMMKEYLADPLNCRNAFFLIKIAPIALDPKHCWYAMRGANLVAAGYYINRFYPLLMHAETATLEMALHGDVQWIKLYSKRVEKQLRTDENPDYYRVVQTCCKISFAYPRLLQEHFTPHPSNYEETNLRILIGEEFYFNDMLQTVNGYGSIHEAKQFAVNNMERTRKCMHMYGLCMLRIGIVPDIRKMINRIVWWNRLKKE